jgi:hypothetical protein
MKSLIDNVSRIWCVMLHSDLMWLLHGHYCCRRCLRQYRIRWNAEEQSFARRVSTTLRHSGTEIREYFRLSCGVC